MEINLDISFFDFVFRFKELNINHILQEASITVHSKSVYGILVQHVLLSGIEYTGKISFNKDNEGFIILHDGLIHSENDEPARVIPDKKIWYFHGLIHRENGPAIECHDAYKEWLINGELHRENGPAIERASGTKEWFINGNRHRDGGLPAIESKTSWEANEWWVNGLRHRDSNLPAVEKNNGDKEWWVNGVRHRIDGPAIRNNDGYKEWWINGKEVCKTREDFKRISKMLSFI